METSISFSAPLWLYSAQSSWHFVTLPAACADEVRFFTSLSGVKTKGFGSVRVQAVSEQMRWKTSLFTDKASQSYLLPIKRDVREAENWQVGDVISLNCHILVDI